MGRKGGVMSMMESGTKKIERKIELETIVCGNCSGKGKVLRVPYYSEQMPEPIEMACEQCRGKGIIILIEREYSFLIKPIINY